MAPERIERSAPIKIGAVAKGLIRKPTPGNSPPADCKIVASAAIKAANINLCVSVHVPKY